MRKLSATVLASLLLIMPAQAQNPADSSKEDEALLLRQGQKADGASLIDYLKKRTFEEPDPKMLEKLVRQLGHPIFLKREEAYAKLLVMGTAALSGVKQGEQDSDAEIRRRSADVRFKIEKSNDLQTQGAVIRLLGAKKPAGAIEALLAYLPFTADVSIQEEITRTLGVVAVAGKKVDPTLMACLEDKQINKRVAAMEVLIEVKNPEYSATFRKYAKDAAPEMRLRAGLGLAELRDKESVPILIDVLKDLGPAQLWRAENVLSQLAGEKTPHVPLGNDTASREACHQAWSKWYLASAATLDLKTLDEETALVGNIVVVYMPVRKVGVGVGIGGQRFVGNGQSEIFELDRTNKVLWKFNNNNYPVAAQVVGQDRVLVAEFGQGRLAEYTTKGELKWSYGCNGNPLGVQRLPNGNTFFYTLNRLVEIDRNNAEVFSIPRPNFDIHRAKLYKNNEILFVTKSGLVTRMTKDQKVLKSFTVPPMTRQFGSVDVHKNGTLLVPDYQQSKVTEYDIDGRPGLARAVAFPSGAQYLNNGNILVFSEQTGRIVELDRQGKEVANPHNAGGNVFSAVKR